MSLDQFDGAFRPSRPGMRQGIDSLPDGEYTAVVNRAELTRTKNTGADIVRWTLTIESDIGEGQYEHTTFLSSQQNVNALGSDLMSIGVPCDTWTTANNKRFSVELPKALGSLAGIRVSVSKTSSENSSNGKTYHNLRFLGRAGATVDDVSPERIF